MLKRKAFTLLELMIVMLIVGFSLMAFAPRIANNTVSVENRLDFFDKLIASELLRSRELGMPIVITGFKGSANIQTYDGKSVTIPNTESIQEAKVNGYETRGLEYAVRVYPDGLVDHFELLTKDNVVIESLPLLMTTRYIDKMSTTGTTDEKK